MIFKIVWLLLEIRDRGLLTVNKKATEPSIPSGFYCSNHSLVNRNGIASCT